MDSDREHLIAKLQETEDYVVCMLIKSSAREASTAAAAPKCILYAANARLNRPHRNLMLMLLLILLLLGLKEEVSPGCIFTLTACTLGLGPGCIFTLTAISKWECSSYGRALALHARGTGNIICVVGGRGKRKDTISLKEVVFTKADESPSKAAHVITSDTESECDNQEPLPPISKLLRAEPNGTSNDVIYIADLTLATTVPKKTKQAIDKVSSVNVTKKKTRTKSPFVPGPCLDKKVASKSISSDQITICPWQLLLTLMEEVKGLKDQIKTPSNNSSYVSQSGSFKSAKGKQKTWFRPCKQCGFRNHLPEECYMKPKCSTCGSTDHLTKEHPEQAVVKKILAKLKV
ncbi:hypothetical protein Tco_0269187 [Tanacetum coccineum]